jgi:phosphoribosyl-AMP cyclohydrolase
LTGEDLLKKLDFKKGSGLIPVVVQDAESKEVLMLAYANEEALEKTLSTGYAHYWSRSRNKLWMKGETSGHTQKIKKVIADCDFDTLLYVVEQKGPACHTGEDTCFHNKLEY